MSLHKLEIYGFNGHLGSSQKFDSHNHLAFAIAGLDHFSLNPLEIATHNNDLIMLSEWRFDKVDRNIRLPQHKAQGIDLFLRDCYQRFMQTIDRCQSPVYHKPIDKRK